MRPAPVAALATDRHRASSPGAASPAWQSPAPRSWSRCSRFEAELHGFVERLDEDDVKALARYAVIAGAVLPFLPNGHYGPLGAWNPQKLWLVVVLVTGFSFLGYVANRIFGERHGTIATALIGGAYSSTAVTQSLAQRLGAKSAAAPSRPESRLQPRSCTCASRPHRRSSRRACCAPICDHCCCRRCVVAGRRACGSTAGRRSRMRRAAPGNPIAILPALGFPLSSPSPRSPRAGREGRFGESGIAVLLLIVGSMDVDTAIITLGGMQPERSRRCSRQSRSPGRSSPTWR